MMTSERTVSGNIGSLHVASFGLRLKASAWKCAHVFRRDAFDASADWAYLSFSRSSTRAVTPASRNAANASAVVPRRRLRTTGASARLTIAFAASEYGPRCLAGTVLRAGSSVRGA